MSIIRKITIATLIIAVIDATAQDSIPDKCLIMQQTIVDNNRGLWQLASLSYANPAVNQWRMKNGLTKVGGGYSSGSAKENPDPRNGSGDRAWQIGASTYTKYRTSTLWGDASYTNGKTLDVVWNETADMSMLYPYLLADSVGGDLKREQYRFSGGYADHRGRWAWGATIGYTALLQYREVDPRPKNVVGRLEISAGALFRVIGNYYAGLDLNIMKYKQTNEIEFKSEMGVDKVFHLTGLASHYNRFAGDGLSTYYDGYRFGVGFNIYPSDSEGAFATCRLSRFTFNNILSDLNKLPLAHVWHNQLEAEAGFLTSAHHVYGGTSARMKVYRRHGTENIFGDAASSVYPVIASNEMYADNAIALAATGHCGVKFGPVCRVQLQVSPEWSHRTTAYIEPYNYKEINSGGFSAGASGALQIGRYWMIETSASMRTLFPYSCNLSLYNLDKEMVGLENAERGAFFLESTRNISVTVTAGATRNIGRYAITLNGTWKHRRWQNSTTINNFDINLNFIF